MNQPSLTADVVSEIETSRADYFSHFSRWIANGTEKTVTIYQNCTPSNHRHPDKNSGGWTLR